VLILTWNSCGVAQLPMSASTCVVNRVLAIACFPYFSQLLREDCTGFWGLSNHCWR
jgi:hypothetical protein